jgi:hypothetical protein
VAWHHIAGRNQRKLKQIAERGERVHIPRLRPGRDNNAAGALPPLHHALLEHAAHASRIVKRLALNSSQGSLSVGSRMSIGYKPVCTRLLSVSKIWA